MDERRAVAGVPHSPMAECIAAFDWAATPLGPSSDWPEGLLADVRAVLGRPFPEALLWGPEFIVCAYNDACRPLLGTASEALGRRFLDVWPASRDAIGARLDEAARGEISRLGETGVTLARDGVVGRAYLDCSFGPVRGSDGKVTAVLLAVAEVTDRVLDREALRGSFERLRLAAEAAGFAGYDFDIERRESLWSNEIRSITRYEGDGSAVPQERILEQIHPDDGDRFERFVASALGASAPVMQEIEFRIVRPDGQVRWVRDSHQVLFEERDGASRAVRVVGTLQDITERHAAEAALRDSDRAKSEFLAILGHELRNPLAPLRTALDLLQRRSPDAAPPDAGSPDSTDSPDSPDSPDSLIPMMDRQLSHLTRLVDDLLELSRIERGQIDMRRAPLHLGDVVDAAVEQTRSVVEARRHELTVRAPTSAVRVEGDFERLTQVLANLLRNAAKYMDRGGRIEVDVARERADALIRVRDDGFGIAADRLEAIFAMFGQIPEHRQRTDGGLGIGLALSRRLMAMHGGSVEALSDGPGQGSEFVMRLPCKANAIEGATPPRVHRTTPAVETSGSARRVLIVDDNVDAAEGLRKLLTLHGHVAKTACDGPDALRTLERFEPELVLLDLGLPGMDGFEVARRLRATAVGATVRLIALTGWGQEADKARTRASGFDDHLTKPIRAAEILSRLEADDRA